MDVGYTLGEWYRLTPYERALEVAHYRYRRIIEALSAMKQEGEAKKQSHKERRK